MLSIFNTRYDAHFGVEPGFVASIYDHLLKGYTVVLNDDFLIEDHLEALFEDIRDYLLERVHQGHISFEQYQTALGHLMTTSTYNSIGATLYPYEEQPDLYIAQ